MNSHILFSVKSNSQSIVSNLNSNKVSPLVNKTHPGPYLSKHVNKSQKFAAQKFARKKAAKCQKCLKMHKYLQDCLKIATTRYSTRITQKISTKKFRKISTKLSQKCLQNCRKNVYKIVAKMSTKLSKKCL